MYIWFSFADALVTFLTPVSKHVQTNGANKCNSWPESTVAHNVLLSGLGMSLTIVTWPSSSSEMQPEEKKLQEVRPVRSPTVPSLQKLEIRPFSPYLSGLGSGAYG